MFPILNWHCDYLAKPITCAIFYRTVRRRSGPVYIHMFTFIRTDFMSATGVSGEDCGQNIAKSQSHLLAPLIILRSTQVRVLEGRTSSEGECSASWTQSCVQFSSNEVKSARLTVVDESILCTPRRVGNGPSAAGRRNTSFSEHTHPTYSHWFNHQYSEFTKQSIYQSITNQTNYQNNLYESTKQSTKPIADKVCVGSLDDESLIPSELHRATSHTW